MDSSNVELTLSLKPSSFVPKSFIHLLTDLYQIENASAKLSKLKIYLNQHKEEMRRVQAFVRDLPHCMLLLNDALEVIQEKISKINNGSVEADRQTVSLIRKKRDQPEIPIISPSNHEWVPTVRPAKRSQTEKMEDSAGTNPMPKFNNNSTVATINNRSPPSSMEITRNGRRIWTPALHSRFVKALHDLGGVEVATPKRIRQRMQVKGLTNDQVKSHLQKFRIYKRAGIQVPQAGAKGSSSSRDAAQTLHHQPAVAMSSEEQRRDPYRSTSRQSQQDPYPFSINYLSAAIPALFSTQTSGSSSREIVGPGFLEII